MAVFVLVHCGFAGGWTWTQVANGLRRAGHEVFTPTLTGLGERAHLADPRIDLDTHVRDVVGVLECEDLHDVLLVASSSGSMAATGAADRASERIKELIYIDTLVPESGQSWIDLVTPAIAAPLLEAAKNFGDGWRVPRNDVQPPRWVAQPLRSVTQPLVISNPKFAGLKRTFVHCTARPEGWFFGLGAVIDEQAKRAKVNGWRFCELRSDHLPMLSAPAETAELLDDLARS